MTTATTATETFKPVRLGRDFILAMLDSMRYVASESQQLRNGYIHTDSNGTHHIYGTDGMIMANYDFENLGCEIEGAFNVSHIKVKAGSQVTGELIAPNTIKIEVYSKKSTDSYIIPLMADSVANAYPVVSSKHILENANYDTNLECFDVERFKRSLSMFVNNHKTYEDLFVKFYTETSLELRVGYLKYGTDNHVAEISAMGFLRNKGVASMPSLNIKYIKSVFDSIDSLIPTCNTFKLLMGDSLKPVTVYANGNTFKARFLIMPLNRA